MMLGIQNFDLRRKFLQIAGGKIFRAFDVDEYACGTRLIRAKANALQVQDDLGYVFDDAFDRGEFVEHSIETDAGKRRSWDRCKQNAAHGVPKRRSISFFKWRGDKPAKGICPRRTI